MTTHTITPPDIDPTTGEVIDDIKDTTITPLFTVTDTDTTDASMDPDPEEVTAAWIKKDFGPRIPLKIYISLRQAMLDDPYAGYTQIEYEHACFLLVDWATRLFATGAWYPTDEDTAELKASAELRAAWRDLLKIISEDRQKLIDSQKDKSNNGSYGAYVQACKAFGIENKKLTKAKWEAEGAPTTEAEVFKLHKRLGDIKKNTTISELKSATPFKKGRPPFYISDTAVRLAAKLVDGVQRVGGDDFAVNDEQINDLETSIQKVINKKEYDEKDVEFVIKYLVKGGNKAGYNRQHSVGRKGHFDRDFGAMYIAAREWARDFPSKSA